MFGKSSQSGLPETLSVRLVLNMCKEAALPWCCTMLPRCILRFRKRMSIANPGLSKEHRLEPQIIIGLLVDQNGFPLGLQSFEGNKAETNTILPVIEAFQAQHRLSKVTVVAHAAMLSSSKLRGAVQQLVTPTSLALGCTRYLMILPSIEESQKWLTSRSVRWNKKMGTGSIYQYRAKRAALDLRNIEKQIAKARKVLSGQIPVKKMKFLSVAARSKQLNQKLIDKARALAGIKGYVTDLDIPDGSSDTLLPPVLSRSKPHSGWPNRICGARPIYHQNREAIEAHLTIVLTAFGDQVGTLSARQGSA